MDLPRIELGTQSCEDCGIPFTYKPRNKYSIINFQCSNYWIFVFNLLRTFEHWSFYYTLKVVACKLSRLSGTLPLAEKLFEVFQRILCLPFNLHFEVQMCTCRSAGRAHFTEGLALGNLLTDAHINL